MGCPDIDGEVPSMGVEAVRPGNGNGRVRSEGGKAEFGNGSKKRRKMWRGKCRDDCLHVDGSLYFADFESGSFKNESDQLSLFALTQEFLFRPVRNSILLLILVSFLLLLCYSSINPSR